MFYFCPMKANTLSNYEIFQLETFGDIYEEFVRIPIFVELSDEEPDHDFNINIFNKNQKAEL